VSAVLLGAIASAVDSTDIVLYPSDVTVIAGMWTRASSTTGAGGLKMTTPDTGFAATAAPLESPAHYFESNFSAPAGQSYQIWLRLRGAADSKWNESVWVQFGDSVSDSGAPLWRIGSTAALLVNLEDCIGCGVSGWGWQDNASWTGDVARVRFATSGTHTIRVQVREDGVDVDQIVLSPLRWFDSSPGSLKNDATIVAKAASGGAVTLLRQPYLQQVTSSSAIVAWATTEPGPAEVRFQSDSGAGGGAAAFTRLVPTTVTGLPSPYYQHEATLTGLTPATSYTYRLIIGGVDAETTDRLTTAPPPGSGTVRFLAFGDSGIGSPEQRQLATRMTAETFDLALHTGDVTYGTASTTGAGGYPQLQSWFFDIYRDWLRSHPVFPTIGNHDDEANFAAPYRDDFVLPSNGASATYPDHAERFYSFDFGPAHFVVLDTELAFQDPARRSAQISWLVDDLLRTSQPWKIAVFHRPPFSAGGEHGYDLTVRAEFVPIFEQYGVSLVLNGHEHDYERTIPWQQTSGGKPVTYVVTGGGGARLYPAAVGPWTAVSRSVFHYVRGAISTCTITLEAVGLDTAVFDSTTLNRCMSGPATSTPYGGVPRAVPGTIQAEDFDEGGDGVAYRDSDTGNAGGGYRPGDVDIESSSDTGDGYNVGWMTAGEWLNYSVSVAQSGTYQLTARVAATGPGGTFHVEFGDVNKTGSLAIPNTGGWQGWTDVTATVALNSGPQTMRFVADGNGPGGVFGNLNFVKLSAGTIAAPEVVLYSADLALHGSWSRIADTTGAAGQRIITPDVGWATAAAPLAAPADYVEAIFNAPANTPYRVWLRMRGTSDSKYNESVWAQFSDATAGGIPAYRIGSTEGLLVNLEPCFNCGIAGWGWQNGAYWLADTGEIRFSTAGPHTIRVQVREDGVQLDQIVLSPGTFLNTRPGSLANDTTIVLRP